MYKLQLLVLTSILLQFVMLFEVRCKPCLLILMCHFSFCTAFKYKYATHHVQYLTVDISTSFEPTTFVT